MSAVTAVAIGPSFGWFHHADGDRGVVMCSAMGYEALCAHQSWRVLADRFAAAGLPTLRFDYPGEGDSLGDADDPALLDNWRDSIRAAVAWMRETVGVRDIVLVGLRLGATLAAEVGGVDHLVQLAPVAKGSAYLRELKIMSRVLAASGPTPPEHVGADDDIDLEGFTITPETFDAIKRIDLARLSACPASRILVVVDPAARNVSDYVARLEALGAAVETRAFANYRALTPAPLPAPAPLADFDPIVAWARSGSYRKRVETPRPGGLATETFAEHGVLFGPDRKLAGVLCEPRGATPKATVVLLNTGANYHIGCGRSSVDYARSLAAHGVASLRIDSLGIGDSDWVERGPRSVLYREERHADVSAALDFLAARGLTNVTLMGICSGAALALYSALKDQRVRGLMLANIQVFNRLDEPTIESVLNSSFGATSTYVAKAMSARSWARVVSGEVPIGKLFAIAGAVARRKAAALLTTSTSALGKFGWLQTKAREAQDNFAALSHRGVRVLVVHGDRDAGREELEVCFGPGGQRLDGLPGVSLEVMSGVDHALSSPYSRDAVFDRLISFLHSIDSGHDARPRERSGSLYGAAAVVALGACSLMANFE